MMRQELVYAMIFWTFMALKVLNIPLAAQSPTNPEPLAMMDGEPIMAREVEKALGAPLVNLEERIYNMKREMVEVLIGDRLLARESTRRKVSLKSLLDSEVNGKIAPVTEQDVEAFYQANKDRLKGDEANLREQIRAHLINQRLAARREAFLHSLRSQSKIVINFEPPRIAVAMDSAPFRGPATAPVTIAEFSDFHCPFCKEVQPTLIQLLSQYPKELKFVYRNFPIDSLHPGALRAAEAACCANDQGKFWAYHDKLFANGPDASPEKLTALAVAVGLDLSAFERCLSSAKYQSAVQKEIEEGTSLRLEVIGTPTFFINGRVLAGAQPFESFVRVIEEELAMMKRGNEEPQYH